VKKVIAIVISVIMMLSVSASAAGIQIGLDSFKLSQNGQTVMELTDPGIRLAFAENEDGVGLRAALEADGQTALEAIVTIGVENVLAKVTGISSVYGVSLEQLAGLAEGAVGTVTQSAGIELTQDDMIIIGEMGTILTNAMENGMYASEDGATMGIRFTDAEIRQLLPLVIKLAENHPEILATAGISAEDLSGITIPADAALLVDAYVTSADTMAVGIKADVTFQGETVNFTFVVETDLNSFVRIAFDVAQGGASMMAMEAVIGISETDGAWIIPANAEFIDAFAMTDAQTQTLLSEAESLLSMFGLAA